MIALVTGPLVWLALAVLLGGGAWRFIAVRRAVQRDAAATAYLNPGGSLRSLARWLVPFATLNMRQRPVVTVVSFAFHAGLLAAPLFLLAHVVLMERALGIRLPAWPDAVATVLVWSVVVGGLALGVRRATDATVRYVSGPRDWLALAVAVAPFVTGLVARHQLLPPAVAVGLHAVCGCVWLASLPWTRLMHLFNFSFTRTLMGSEYAHRSARDW
jgi:nitrate reductase gamma subunit